LGGKTQRVPMDFEGPGNHCVVSLGPGNRRAAGGWAAATGYLSVRSTEYRPLVWDGTARGKPSEASKDMSAHVIEQIFWVLVVDLLARDPGIGGRLCLIKALCLTERPTQAG
jgi:hypothetical protein